MPKTLLIFWQISLLEVCAIMIEESFWKILFMGEYDMISRLYHQETMEDCCNYFLMVLDRIFAENRKKKNRLTPEQQPYGR